MHWIHDRAPSHAQVLWEEQLRQQLGSQRQRKSFQLKEFTSCMTENRATRAGGPATAAPAAAPAAEAPKVEEKTEFDVKLAGFDAAAKIKVIKEVRAITSLGLKEAKELVSPFPLSRSRTLFDPGGC